MDKVEFTKTHRKLISMMEVRTRYAEFVNLCTIHNVPVLDRISFLAVVHDPNFEVMTIDSANDFIANNVGNASNDRVGKCGGCGSATPEISRGLGDTIAKVTHATGLSKLTELYTQITGKDCGCSTRQAALNKLFPYGIKEE